MKLKKLSLEKETLLPLNEVEAVNIAGGIPVSGTIPALAHANVCNPSDPCTTTTRTANTACNQATCATCATNCGTCATCATNCGTCATCGCTHTNATCASDCRCPSGVIPAQHGLGGAVANTCYC